MADLRALLHEAGATDAETSAAEADGTLALLAAERVVFEGGSVYDLAGVARAAGVDVEVARRYWRALGFVDPLPGAVAFSAEDARALRAVAAGVGSTEELEWSVQRARSAASALARVADLWADAVREAVESGVRPEDVVATFTREMLDESLWQIGYVFRRQLLAAIARALTRTSGGAAAPVAVGFADLVGFTPLSGSLPPDELLSLVTRFESVAYDTVAEHGGRVVKLIGDEVMFVAGQPDVCVGIARAVIARAAAAGLPDMRAGVAHGPAIVREGDVFGGVVALAARLVKAAEPGGVAMAGAWAPSVPRASPLGTAHLRGIGDVEVWHVRA